MYSSLQLTIKYVRYWLIASNGKGHGIHSPFVFQFITEVLNDDREYYCYSTIERLRRQLKRDKREMMLEDFGAGSRIHAAYRRRVCDIAKTSLKSKKFCQLFFRIINFYFSGSLEKDATILELGTSLGITTAYLASVNKNFRIITIEGAKAVADFAKKNFQQLELSNIELIEGNFDSILIQTLKELSPIDFAFIDGNHRSEPTINYFKEILAKTSEHSILVFDDIRWSREMEKAWEYIKHHESVTLTIDLFFIGIIFFRKEQRVKQHFTIRF